jgi:predicted nucleic acid-binding protein
VYRYLSSLLALDAEQQSRGIVVPFADLLIGATALSLGYSVLTVNARHFGRIPGLSVIEL